MVESPAARAPLRHQNGHLPLEDHGVVGDGHTIALVARNGSIVWMCLPRFDSAPVFCRLLDVQRGGELRVAPDHILDARQYYEPDTAVLVTELRGPNGLLRITDACVLKAGADLSDTVPADRGELQRTLHVLHGQVRVRVLVRPFGDATHAPSGDGMRIRLEDRPDVDLQLWATHPLAGPETEWDLREGDEAVLCLGWKGSSRRGRPSSPQERLDATRTAWRRWMRLVRYEGPHGAMVRRSAITLKLLDYFQRGSMVAAATSSLPEWIGGRRNWDYRYTWIRDAAFAVHALRRIGMGYEASAFLAWVLDAADERTRPCVLYTLDGTRVPDEWEDERLRGYRGSTPVRWGNDAVHQHQHDVFGEVMDCAYQWVRHGGRIDASLWDKLREMADAAAREWDTPDQGIWEVRTEGHPFTYSAALCQVALDRIAKIARMQELPGPVERWASEAARIRRGILERAWDPERECLREHLEGGSLDASLLTLPLRRVLDARHPRMIATTRAIARHLSAGDGLLYRYRPEESPDGVSEDEEGAFLLCSFWHVENLVLQEKREEAGALFESLCARANQVGLLAEQVDPSTGAFLGNFPQAMSHVGLIAAAVRLDRHAREGSGR
jgi:alpha,alpha-trehalase